MPIDNYEFLISMLNYFDFSDNVVAFCTTRHGGCSVGNYGSFNINPYCGDSAEAVAANKSLDTAVADLYREMGDLSLSDKDEDYRQNLYADFNSRNDTISHDPYNQYAQEYMDTLDGFPAGLIAAIMPVKEAAAAY